jgi:hypothetical protein
MFHALKHIFYPLFSLLYNFTSERIPKHIFKMVYDPKENDEKIYLSIDHLKKGTYKLNILLKNEIIKTIKFIKR